MNTAPKIGVVIPIYNVAPYLRECLDSVIAQTYGNFHAVLVNDGSTDILETSTKSDSRGSILDDKLGLRRHERGNKTDLSIDEASGKLHDLSPKDNAQISESLKIALEYVAKDKRFVLIDKPNGGLSSARNAGIFYFTNSLGGNSSLEKHSADFEIFGASQTASLVSAPKISKNHESHPENPSVVLNTNLNEPDSSLQGESIDSPKQFAEFANAVKQPSKNSPSLAENETHSLPLPCGGGLRGWVISPKMTLYAHPNHINSAPPKIDYIIFLDSDDFWEADLLEKCVDSAIKYNAEIVWFSWHNFIDGTPKNSDMPNANWWWGDLAGFRTINTRKRA